MRPLNLDTMNNAQIDMFFFIDMVGWQELGAQFQFEVSLHGDPQTGHL